MLRSYPVLCVACVFHGLFRLIVSLLHWLLTSGASRWSARCLECSQQGIVLPGSCERQSAPFATMGNWFTSRPAIKGSTSLKLCCGVTTCKRESGIIALLTGT